MQNNTQTTKKWSVKKKILVSVCIFVGLGLSLISGILQFAAATVSCGKLPVAASSFAAGYSYIAPGDTGYGPNPFNNHYFCSAEQAKSAGYHHSPLTAAGAKEQANEFKHQQDKERFTPEKIDFIAYTPTSLPVRFTKDNMTVQSYGGPQEVFQYLKTGELSMATMRQAKFADDSSYWVCHYDACSEIGKDAAGHVIYKSHSDNNGSIFWGIKVGSTFFNIEAESRAQMTDAEATQIFNSLVPASTKL